MGKLSYSTRRFVCPQYGDTLDIEFNRAPSNFVRERLRALGYRYHTKINSWRGHSNFDAALEAAQDAVMKSRAEPAKSATICWNCENVYNRCKKPVAGWTAKYNEERGSYTVIKCPNFVPDKPRKKNGNKSVR